MDKPTARQIGDVLAGPTLSNRGRYVVGRIRGSTPLQGFHQWADDRPLVGAYRVVRRDGAELVILLIDWRLRDDWYLVVCSPNTHAPLAQIHRSVSGTNRETLEWRYRPSKQDGNNGDRMAYFRKRVGADHIRIAVPTDRRGGGAFLDNVYQLIDERLRADTLGSEPSGYSSGRVKSRKTLTKQRSKTGWRTAVDIAEPPKRTEAFVSRVVRDTGLTRQLKLMHDNRCQLCKTRLSIDATEAYSEAHHLRPLGRPHNGTDVAENILILCPNCHARCDLASVTLRKRQLATVEGHNVSAESLRYHNELVGNSGRASKTKERAVRAQPRNASVR